MNLPQREANDRKGLSLVFCRVGTKCHSPLAIPPPCWRQKTERIQSIAICLVIADDPHLCHRKLLALIYIEYFRTALVASKKVTWLCKTNDKVRAYALTHSGPSIGPGPRALFG
jgi:hypothetical protein